MNLMIRHRRSLDRKTPDLMPMTCEVTRIGKGKYLCELHFALSKRYYDCEVIECRTKTIAKHRVKRMHPNIVRFRK
jgi:hypothetical protein